MRAKNLLNVVIPMALSVAVVTACGAKSGGSESSTTVKSTDVTTSSASEESKTSTVSNSSSSTSSSSAVSTASFPIAMKHAYGETVINAKPERVVTLDWNNADAVLALGIVPVGTARANWGPVTDKGLLPWTEEKFKELGTDNPNVFNDLEGYDYEAVAAAKPDIIVAPYSGMDEKAYKRLSEIAPTLPFKETAWKTTWREQTVEVAEALGLRAEGEKLVADTDAFIKENFAKYPKLANKSAAICYINAGDDKTVAALQKDAIFSKIPAVKEGRVVVLDSNGNLAAACNPSVLSIKAELVNYLEAINAVVQ